MKLLIDVGNSRIKWAYLSKNILSTTKAQLHSDDATAICESLFQQQNITQILFVHVLGEEFDRQIRQIADLNSANLFIVHSQSEAYGVSNHYIHSQKLGADRFVSMVAAHHHYSEQNCIVIDCGTAVTIDLVNKDGKHNGGVIFSGLHLCEESLIAKARNLKELKNQLRQVDLSIHANGTAQGIKTGCHYSLAATIDRICEEMEASIPTHSQTKRIICGGDARQILPLLHGEYDLKEDLVIQGLKLISHFTR